MKPSEYYNYPQKRKRIWWLPLALIPVLILINAVFHPFESRDAASTETGSTQQQAVNGNYHTVLLDGLRYNILDQAYPGDYDLLKLRFAEPSQADGSGEELLIPTEQDQAVPASFPQEQIFTRAAYEAFCETWGLPLAFPEHTGSFVVIARGAANSGSCEVQLGDAAISGSRVTVVLRDRFQNQNGSSVGYVLTIPVPEGVTELNTEALFTQEEYENLRKEAASGPTVTKPAE